MADADGVRELDVLFLLLRDGLAARDTRIGHPLADGKHEHQVQDPCAQHDQHHDRQQDEGKGQLNVGQAHDDIVSASARIAGDHAQHGPDHAADHHRRHADQNRDARAVDQTREHIASQPVAAQPIFHAAVFG